MRGHASVPDTKPQECAMRHMRTVHLDHALFDLHYIISIIPLRMTRDLVLFDVVRYGVLN